MNPSFVLEHKTVIGVYLDNIRSEQERRSLLLLASLRHDSLDGKSRRVTLDGDSMATPSESMATPREMAVRTWRRPSCSEPTPSSCQFGRRRSRWRCAPSRWLSTRTSPSMNPSFVLKPETFDILTTSTLNPQPSALNSTPLTLNPTPYTPNPQPYTLNPQPSTLNPKP